MKILTVPNSNLRKKASTYSGKFDSTLSLTIGQMFEVMRAHKGIGLAGPQVGLAERVAVIEIDTKRIVLINPEVVRKSTDEVVNEEGCLSIPGVWGMVRRPAQVKVRARNQFGKLISFKATGLLAVVVQHEIDHLDGILFTDKVIAGTLKQEDRSKPAQENAI